MLGIIKSPFTISFNKLILLFSLFIFIPSSLSAASATFLKIPVGARPAALGGAFSAFKGDVNSIAYNPAGLAFVNEMTGSFMRANYIGGLNHDWLAYAQPYKNSVNAIGINSLSVKSIDGYANDGTPADSVSSSDLALNFAHARKLSDKIGFGVNLKYISERLDTERANAFAFDAGLLMQSPIENLDFAVVAENIGSKMKFIEDSFYLPSRFKAGFLYKRNVLNLKCAYSAEMVIPSDGKKSFLTGLETIVKDRFALRAGWQNARDLGSNITYGLGYMLKVSQKMDMNIDYAFADYGEFGNVHRFGLTIKFAGDK
jgi:hypothetical protein